MAQDVCPWWLGFLLASPIRRLAHEPARILAPYLAPGMTVLEPGPGMGFFTLEMARRVGPGGRVVAVDIQPRMLEGLQRRARRAGLADRIKGRLAHGSHMGVEDLGGSMDFVLAFAVVHEMPDPGAFFAQVAACLKKDGLLLFVEPAGRVSGDLFGAELRAAREAGLVLRQRPVIRRSLCALLARE